MEWDIEKVIEEFGEWANREVLESIMKEIDSNRNSRFLPPTVKLTGVREILRNKYDSRDIPFKKYK